MAPAPTVRQGEDMPPDLWQLVDPILAAALTALVLDSEFSAVRISADDLPGDDECWYGLLPGPVGDTRPVLVLSCHLDAFCRHRPLQTTVRPPQAVWEQAAAPRHETLPTAAEYSADRAAIFLHHHLQTVADLRRGGLKGVEVPPHLSEAFAAAWSVVVDGRLGRLHLPGYPIPERRGRFSRLFSPAGILLPEHWQIFQSLWDGALDGPSAVLAVVRLLPRLQVTAEIRRRSR